MIGSRPLKIGVPSGVGDVYWCLTKLKPLLAGRRATLCVQKSMYDRARDWSQMVDFVDEAVEYAFEPGPARESGFTECHSGLDCVLWPNAVIDRGERIETWLPDLPTDLSFHVKHPDMGAPRVVVYASSHQIAASWIRKNGEAWGDWINKISETVGPVTLVGAAWDLKFRRQISASVEDLCGQTTLPELAGLLAGARVVLGVISGVTILANHFRTPCVALWPDSKFPVGFPTAWTVPEAPYTPIAASALNWIDVPQEVKRLARPPAC